MSLVAGSDVAIPLSAVPSQTVQVGLAGQNCNINVYQKGARLYVDLLVDGEPIILGVVGENLNRIVRSAYLGFVGDLAFVDNEAGGEDPVYTGLGTRFSLLYFQAEGA